MVGWRGLASNGNIGLGEGWVTQPGQIKECATWPHVTPVCDLQWEGGWGGR